MKLTLTRTIISIAMSLILATVLLTPTPAAQAAPLTNKIWEYVQTRRCLDNVGPRADQTYNYGVPCSNTNNERWQLTKWSSGWHRVQNRQTRLCLYAWWDGGKYVARSRSCIGGADEGWRFDTFSNGTFRVRNHLTNTCLDEYSNWGHNRFQLHLRPCAKQVYTAKG